MPLTFVSLSPGPQVHDKVVWCAPGTRLTSLGILHMGSGPPGRPSADAQVAETLVSRPWNWVAMHPGLGGRNSFAISLI